jgi:tetratricopeptide (TPR) repeat protein
MKKVYSVVLLLLIYTSAFAGLTDFAGQKQDTTEVINLYLRSYDMMLTDAGQSIKYADRALNLAHKLKYTKGLANAYRVKGLSEFYAGNSVKAIENYLSSLAAFQKIKDAIGEVRIYMNISSLYQDVDFDKCLEYLQAAQDLYQAKKLNNKDLLAAIYLNLGNVYQLQTNYSKALLNYNKCYDLNKKFYNPILEITVLQNMGVIYSSIGNTVKAKEYLFKALKGAKEQDLNLPVAQINLSLSEIYIADENFSKAESCLTEGKAYAVLSKNDNLGHSFQKSSYLLELKRKNYEKALAYLQSMYKQDSVEYQSRNSAALSLYQANYKQEELKREKEQILLKNEKILLRQQYDRSLAIGTVILAGFLVLVILLLINNVRRKAETNKKLTELNTEISIQKDNLDRINHHLEEIIDERTKDLQLKNKKLSEYSSHLSHQIRGPIATLKGLMNLEQEGLVSQEECIQMMIKCVSEIDDKIIDMSDMLHNPQRAGL